MNRRGKLKKGDIYWLENRLLENSAIQFGETTSGDLHPVVVVGHRSGKARVRVMTSKIERYENRGIIYRPTSDVRLKNTGVIVTIPDSHQQVPAASLQSSNYLGNVGPRVLKQIRRSERKKVYGDLGGNRHKRILWLIVVCCLLAFAAYQLYTKAGLPFGP